MINPRLFDLTDYPFQRLRDLLDGIEPGQADVINMSIGEPQHAYPDLLGETLAANAHLYGKYPPAPGTPELLDAASAWATRRYGLPQGMIEGGRHVCALNGTREGLFMAAQLVTPPGGKAGKPAAILVPNPFYQCYIGASVMAGAEPVFLPATAENDFLPDLDSLDEELLARTAAFYLCSPANPQGTVAGAEYLERAIRLARAHDFVLLLDECYAEIYDGPPPVGGLEVCARMGGELKNLLVFHSLSKRSNAPGLRSGFVAGDPGLIAALVKLRSYGGAPSPLPVSAAAAALWRDEAHVVENRSLYRRKFDLAQRILGNRFGFYRPPGGFFLWLDVGDGEAAARELWARAGLRCLPGEYLAREDGTGENPGAPYIRLALVNDLDTTERALTRLSECLQGAECL